MELSYLMLSGSLSGLLSVLAHSVALSALEIFRGRAATVPLAMPQVSDALLHMLCGAGLGLLFWLSWGLAAVVAVPWWVRGISFGGLCWLSLALPCVLSLASAGGATTQGMATPDVTAPDPVARGVTMKVAAVVASRWATTCLIAGLACAWSWGRTL